MEHAEPRKKRKRIETKEEAKERRHKEKLEQKERFFSWLKNKFERSQ